MWAAQSAFAVMSPLVHTSAKSSNVWFSPISHSLIHISVVVMCCCCFHTMPRAGWMLSKCGFTWAIKWAVLFLCCSDTSVGAAFKGIGLFCSFIYWNAAQFLSLTLKFLSIISCDSFLQSFSLWIARIIFIFNIFVFSWNQILSLAIMVVYLLFLPTPAVLLFAAATKTPKKPHVCQAAWSLSQCSSSSHSLDQVGFVISLIFSFMWDRKALCYWWQPRILIACSLLGFFGCLLFGVFFPFIFYIKPLFYRWIKTVGVAGIYSGKEGW